MTLAGSLQAGASFVAAGSAQSTQGSIIGPALRATGQISNYYQPNETPSISDLMAALSAGTLGPAHAERLFRCAGVTPELILDRRAGARGPTTGAYGGLAVGWKAVYESRLTVPSPGETLALFNRNKIDSAQTRTWLRRNGIVDVESLRAFEELAQVLPTPSDLVSFALKEAWDQPTVDRFGYDAEFPPEFAYWMERLGANSSARVPGQPNQGNRPLGWANLYWRTHWANIAPTQAYEMFQRLRPNRIERFHGELPNVRPFTLEDLQTVLKINDYPVPFRDQLAAIAYRVPRLIDVQRYNSIGLIRYPEVVELHKDMGFNDVEARRRADFVVQYNTHQKYVKATGTLRAEIIADYRLGLIDEYEAARRMFEYLYYGYEEHTIWMGLDDNAKARVALQDAGVAAVLRAAERKARHDDSKRRLDLAHKSYVRGQASKEQCAAALRRARINERKIETYIAQWDEERFLGNVYWSTSRHQQLYVEGLINMQYLRDGLERLGWTGTYIDTLATEAQMRRNEKLSKIAAKELSNEGKRRSDLIKLAKAAEAQHKAAIAALNKQSSPSQLRRYYIRGLISEAQLREELAARGFEDGSINTQVAEAILARKDDLSRREKASQPAKPKGTVP